MADGAKRPWRSAWPSWSRAKLGKRSRCRTQGGPGNSSASFFEGFIAMSGSRMLRVLGWLVLLASSVTSVAAASAPNWQSEREKAIEDAEKKGHAAASNKAGHE